MTQSDFDALPLLLRYGQVASVLEINRRALLDSIADGSLRCWPQTPDPRRRRYYLKVDVARMAGLRMNLPRLDRLNGWLRRGELLELLGVGQHFFHAACREGLLACDREPRPRQRLRLQWPPSVFGAANGIAGS